MKIKKSTTHHNKRLSIIWVSLVLLAVLGGGAYATSRLLSQNDTQPTATAPSNDTSTDTKQGSSTSPTQTEDSSKTPVQNSVDQPSNEPKTNLTITAVNKTGNTLQARALIDALWQDGECTLTMSGPDGATLRRTAKTQTLSNETTCMGFDIDTSGLHSGSWKLSISATNGDVSISDSQEVAI